MKKATSALARAAVLALAAGLSGCATFVTTPDAPLGLAHAGAPMIGVDKDDMDVWRAAAACDGANYFAFRADFYKTLASPAESSGLVAASADAPLRLVAAFKNAAVAPQTGVDAYVLGVASVFLPPLAVVKSPYSEAYAVKFGVFDRDGRAVYRRTLKGVVSGAHQGWFVWRIDGYAGLCDELAAAAARAAARDVLRDLDAHAGEIAKSARGGAGTR